MGGPAAEEILMKWVRREVEESMWAALNLVRRGPPSIADSDVDRLVEVLSSKKDPASEYHRFMVPTALAMLGRLTIEDQLALVDQIKKTSEYGFSVMRIAQRVNLALSWLHDRAAMKRMNQRVQLDRSVRSVEDLRAWAGELGWSLEDPDKMLNISGRLAPGIRTSLWSSLEDNYMGYASGIPVVDHRRIRIMTAMEVKEYWRDRLKSK